MYQVQRPVLSKFSNTDKTYTLKFTPTGNRMPKEIKSSKSK